MAKKNIQLGAGTRSKPSAAAARSGPAEKPLKVKNRRDLHEYLRRLGPYPRSARDGIDLGRLRIDWHLRRARIVGGWNDNLAEINYPTEALTVDYAEGRQRVVRNPTRVRQSEAWRHNQLTAMQRQAETGMQIAWTVLVVGRGPAISRYGERAPGSSPVGAAQELSAGLEDDFVRWSQNALAKKIPIALVLEILTEPRTLAEIERSRKLKPGKALDVYRRGLDLWCELRGWTRRNARAAPSVPLTSVT